MANVTLKLLGDFSVHDGAGPPLEISAKKARALLAVVALSPGFSAPRERLAGLLWSGRGEPQARSSLRQTLTVLRKELGSAAAAVLGGGDDRVEFPGAGMSVDAVEFATLAASADRDELRGAVALWKGELLADTFIADAAFEEWLGGERDRLRDLFTGTLQRLIPREAAADRIPLAKQLLALDPLREASHVILLKAYSEAGDRAQALLHFNICKETLKRELGVAPGREILAVIDSLRAREPMAAPKPPAAAAGAEPKLTIAVLPFANLSGDPEQQYFADGLSEDLIIALARFSDLRVVSRSAAFRLPADADSGAAASALDAAYVLKGSARVNGGRLIVSCQFIEAASGKTLWGERYDRRTDDVFAVQDDVVNRIVTALGVKLRSAAVSELRRKPTGNWTAYDYFLQGREICNAGREEDAEAYFAKAVDLDPEFAQAHAWRAIGFMGKFWTTADRTQLLRARDSAEAALRLEPNEASTHHAVGIALTYLGQQRQSLTHFERALELNPLDVNIRGDYANLLLHLGLNEEALAAVDAALSRDPYPPVWMLYVKGTILFYMKRYEDVTRVLEQSTVYGYRARAYLAAAHAYLGNIAEARRQIDQMLKLKPGFSSDTLRSTVAFVDRSQIDEVFDGLRLAGFEDPSGRPHAKE